MSRRNTDEQTRGHERSGRSGRSGDPRSRLRSALGKLRAEHYDSITPDEFVELLEHAPEQLEGMLEGDLSAENYLAELLRERMQDQAAWRQASVARCASCGLALRLFWPVEELVGGKKDWTCSFCGWQQTGTAAGCADSCESNTWHDLDAYLQFRDIAVAGGYSVPEEPPYYSPNPPSDPEQPDVRFYPVCTGFTEGSRHLQELAGLHDPKRFYEGVLSTWRHFGARLSSDQYASAVIEGTWYSYFQPEYKAYPAIIAALAATKIEIGCEHLRLPFPAFVIRLPEGFVQEEGGPPIRALFVAMMKNYGHRTARPVTSIDSEPAAGSLTVPFAFSFRNEDAAHVLMIQAKYIDKDGDDAFANFMFSLKRDKTIEEQFSSWLEHSKTLDAGRRRDILRTGGYFMGDRLARELLSLAIGVSFFATGRHKSERPILQREKRPRPERRRFEREHDGEEQPTFTVGRELVLPREEGAPAPDSDGKPGEGSGRSLKWAHYRTGHLRYQAHGPALSERKLIFIEPQLVRPDLPMGTRVTPGGIVGGKRTRDVTDTRGDA